MMIGSDISEVSCDSRGTRSQNKNLRIIRKKGKKASNVVHGVIRKELRYEAEFV